MRVAVAASLLKAITKESTGGTEAFSYLLAQGLVEKGVDVTLFATSDSETNAQLVSVCSSKQTTGVYEGNVEIRTVYQIAQACDIIAKSKDFDIIHNNYFAFYMLTSLAQFTDKPVVTTMHNHFWHYPNLKSVLINSHRKGKDMVVFASKAAQKLSEGKFDTEVIYHGIDIMPFLLSKTSQEYILFLGRIIPAKGIKDAMDAARIGNFTLKVGGGAAIFPDDKAFVAEHVTPYFSDTITPVGSPSDEERLSLYQNAKALLFPTQIEEQFGLVAVEAMACGTPVIAYNRGALSEVIKDGVTGFIIDPDGDSTRDGFGTWAIKKQGVEGLIEAVKRIGEINREECRKHVEKYFMRDRMIDEYIQLYKRLTG